LPVDAPCAAGKLRRTQPIVAHEFAFLSAHTARTPKIALPAPSYHFCYRGRDSADPAAYPDAGSCLDGLVAVYRAEPAELGRLGATDIRGGVLPSRGQGAGVISATPRLRTWMRTAVQVRFWPFPQIGVSAVHARFWPNPDLRRSIETHR